MEHNFKEIFDRKFLKDMIKYKESKYVVDIETKSISFLSVDVIGIVTGYKNFKFTFRSLSKKDYDLILNMHTKDGYEEYISFHDYYLNLVIAILSASLISIINTETSEELYCNNNKDIAEFYEILSQYNNVSVLKIFEQYIIFYSKIYKLYDILPEENM